MSTIASSSSTVTATFTVGIDTHSEFHVASVLNQLGRKIASRQFATTTSGNASLLDWISEHGVIDAVGVEGTGSYGAQIARDLTAAGHRVIEVDRPDRKARRQLGKDDHLDADAAAQAVQSGRASTIPKERTGTVEAIRTLRIVRRSAVLNRTAAMNQLKALLVTAPGQLREQLRGLTNPILIRTTARLRPAPDLSDPTEATKYAMRELAQRHQSLTEQIKRLDIQLKTLVTTTAPALVMTFGVGIDTAGALLVAAGDNPERLRSESSFAHLCGVAPLPASSGKTNRHRLNRGGNRSANNALWTIALVRMGSDQRTKDYVARRTAQGLSKREIMRCLKRYIAREIFTTLTANQLPNAA